MWQSVCTARCITGLFCTVRCISWESTQASLQFLACKQHKETFLFSPTSLSKKSQSCPSEIHWVVVIWVQGSNLLSHVLEINTSFEKQGWTASSEIWFGSTPLLYVLSVVLQEPTENFWEKTSEKCYGQRENTVKETNYEEGKSSKGLLPVVLRRVILFQITAAELIFLLQYLWLQSGQKCIFALRGPYSCLYFCLLSDNFI